MAFTAQCPHCGNARALFNQCPYCGSDDLPTLSSDTIEINIKQGSPHVEEALELLTEQLRKCSELGIKAITSSMGMDQAERAVVSNGRFMMPWKIIAIQIVLMNISLARM